MCTRIRETGRCGCHYRELLEGFREVCRDQKLRDQSRKRQSVGREY